MPRLRLSWLWGLLLGGLLLTGISRAQNSPDGELTLELLQRIERLEAEVRQIRGELEIQRHQIETLAQERAAGYPRQAPPAPIAAPTGAPPVDRAPPAGVPSQPGSVQPPVSAAPPPAPVTAPAPPPAPPARPAVGGSEQADFDAAVGELREGRYPQAMTDLQRFLSSYPNSNRAGDAQYWLGEASYLSRNYDAAKEAFINLGLHYPKSTRLPDALLKLGYIYGEQGDTARAREVLQKLVQVYPDTQAAKLAERRLQSLN